MGYTHNFPHIYFVDYSVLQTLFENPAIRAGDPNILRNYSLKPGSALKIMVRAGLTRHLVII